MYTRILITITFILVFCSHVQSQENLNFANNFLRTCIIDPSVSVLEISSEQSIGFLPFPEESNRQCNHIPDRVIKQENYKISVGKKGEAHLKRFSTPEKMVCEAHLFQRSALGGLLGSSIVQGTCSRKTGFFECQALVKGTVAHKDCKGQVTETGDAIIIEAGTWYTVSYYSAIDLTLIVVLEGNIEAAARYADGFGQYKTVSSGHIWITQPDDPNGLFWRGRRIDPDGQILDINLLPEIITELQEICLDYPHKVDFFAKASEIAFPQRSIEVASRPLQNIDKDNDLLDSCEEVELNANPLKKNSDDDCLDDYDEHFYKELGGLLTNSDTDGDGVKDGCPEPEEPEEIEERPIVDRTPPQQQPPQQQPRQPSPR